MNVTITPSQATGAVMAPPSKSMAHRALICGALSQGSTVRNLAWSKDIEATVACLQALGADIERDGNSVTIGGLNLLCLPADAVLPCNESGSTLRFFLPLCMLCGQTVTLTGSPRLMERPLGVYEEICREQGIRFCKSETSITVCGKLKAGEYTIPGDISSQFITGLLFALPFLEGDSRLTVTGRFESASYVDLTLAVMGQFGIVIYREGNSFRIPGCQVYAPAVHTVEGDCSNAAFLEGFNLLGGDVKLFGLTAETLQGDRIYRDFYRQMLAGEKQFDLSDCPDLAPVLFALSAALGGAHFTGTARLRIKESDRGAAMAEELEKFGIAVTIGENTVTIHPGVLKTPFAMLSGHNDHRIVMALSLLCTVTGGTIEGAEAVDKSFPEYFDILKSLQIGLTLYETGPQ